jgi:ubiquitin C-terminal hydrolase
LLNIGNTCFINTGLRVFYNLTVGRLVYTKIPVKATPVMRKLYPVLSTMSQGNDPSRKQLLELQTVVQSEYKLNVDGKVGDMNEFLDHILDDIKSMVVSRDMPMARNSVKTCKISGGSETIAREEVDYGRISVPRQDTSLDTLLASESVSTMECRCTINDCCHSSECLEAKQIAVDIAKVNFSSPIDSSNPEWQRIIEPIMNTCRNDKGPACAVANAPQDATPGATVCVNSISLTNVAAFSLQRFSSTGHGASQVPKKVTSKVILPKSIERQDEDDALAVYTLRLIVVHSGDHLHDGHWMNYFSDGSGKWWECSDASVRSITEADVMDVALQNATFVIYQKTEESEPVVEAQAAAPVQPQVRRCICVMQCTFTCIDHERSSRYTYACMC